MIRGSKPNAGRKPRLRTALSRLGRAIEDRLLWEGADLLRGIFDVVRWPFERAAWTVERRAMWPVQKRTAGWSSELRTGSAAALALVAVGAGVLGLVLASAGGSAGTNAVAARSAEPLPVPAATRAPAKEVAQAGPVLHGAPPDFTAEDKVGPGKPVAPAAAASDGSGEASAAGGGDEPVAGASSAPAAGAGAKVVAVGPGATQVAHRFADAFVHFETGQLDKGVRTAFASTATPELARSLLRRPPRLPANVKVPRAKVLNIVPGPKVGDAHTVSVSLLRVGVTSELRITMERDPASHEWQVTDVLG